MNYRNISSHTDRYIQRRWANFHWTNSR